MQERAKRTREALIRATAELIGNEGLNAAGLVNVCRTAGVSRGALYHHFDTMEALVAAVRLQAREELGVLIEDAFETPSYAGAARFSTSLGRALGEDVTLRAGLQLGPSGSGGSPRLFDEALGLVRRRVSECEADDLADLVMVVTAGLESLGRRDAVWWDPGTAERVWLLLEPLLSSPRPGSSADG
ncbi:TetR family transcriptional regulator [Streptomyces sp. NPDC054961]